MFFVLWQTLIQKTGINLHKWTTLIYVYILHRNYNDRSTHESFLYISVQCTYYDMTRKAMTSYQTTLKSKIYWCSSFYTRTCDYSKRHGMYIKSYYLNFYINMKSLVEKTKKKTHCRFFCLLQFFTRKRTVFFTVYLHSLWRLLILIKYKTTFPYLVIYKNQTGLPYRSSLFQVAFQRWNLNKLLFEWGFASLKNGYLPYLYRVFHKYTPKKLLNRLDDC